MASSKLPRVKHAPKPRPDEKVMRRSGADLNNGWLARHGTLYLTEERLVFVPTPLDTAMQAKRRQLMLDELLQIERWPAEPGTMPRGGKRPRLLVHTEACVYEFLLPDLDAWYDVLEATMWRRHWHEGRPLPRFVRQGVENPMFSPDERARFEAETAAGTAPAPEA